MSDLIDKRMARTMTKDEVIAVLRGLQDWLYFSAMNGGTKIQREAIDVAIEAIHSEPQRMRGKWIHVSEEMWKCDQCEEISCCSPNFCPDCGADMRGERQ